MNAGFLYAHDFELRFDSLFQEGRALAFPCDAHGRVDLDGLSERARSNYFFAREQDSATGRWHAAPPLKPKSSPW